MGKSGNNKDTNGIGWFLYALTLMFIFLKLTGYIDWGWHLVFAPLIIPIVIGLVLSIIGLIILGVNNRWE